LEVVVLTVTGAGDGKGVSRQNRFQNDFIDHACHAPIDQFPVISHIKNEPDLFKPAIDASSNGHQVVAADHGIWFEFFNCADIKEELVNKFPR
jgi:hypothetical protein